MRNLKKFLALVLAMMMAFSLMVTANAKNAKKDYNDLEGAAFGDAIDVLTGMGVFKGNDGNFGPQRPITRAEAVAVLYRLVTGDVTDSQKDLYIPAASFTDVSPNAWYAGYVGFAVDAGLVKGWNGTFMPTKEVTGYEMLAMLLRAAGYGKNGEFTGSNWMINAGYTAQSLGILDSIKSTHYENTLAMSSAREVVAQLTFETATKVNMVNWTMMGGYSKYDQLLGGKLNPTLGEKVFKLTSVEGIIVGNQETGENKTLVSYDYTIDEDTKAVTIDISYNHEAGGDTKVDNLDIKTGLDLYGHKVTAWYKDGSSVAYAVIDEAESDTVYTDKENAADIAKAAGMKDAEDSVQCSATYGRFGDSLTTSPIKMYTVIDNDGNGKADVIISLDAVVAEVIETKTTAKPQTITLDLGDSAPAEFDETFAVSGAASKVVGDFDIKTALGEVFTVWKVTKTTDDSTKSYVMKTPLKTVTGTVTTYKVAGDGETVISVNAVVNGETKTIKRSGILEAGQAFAYNVEAIKAGVTYTFYLDQKDESRFVGFDSPNEYSFLYATYADFQYGAMGTGEIEYKVYGIDWNGKNVNDHNLVSLKLSEKEKYPGEDATLGDGYQYGLNITRKNMAGNNVQKGVHMAFMIDSKGNMTREITDGSQLFNDEEWTITSKDAANGFAKVKNGSDYMLTSDTVFYVVSGFGVNATVKPYNGLKDLVGSSTGVKINPDGNEVWFQTGADKFDSVNTDKNKTITKVILSIDNLEWYSNENLYFAPAGIEATGVKLASVTGVNQYELWLNGVKGTYWIKDGDETIEEQCGSENHFYTLAKASERNGVTIYAATMLDSEKDPKDAPVNVGGVCNSNTDGESLKYEYVMVNNYSKADIEGVTMNVAGAAVADVEFDAGLEEDNRIEIKDLRTLNNAVSTGYTVQVAIVNNGIDVSTIYVLSVTPGT